MTDRGDQDKERDDLDLDAETIRDLEPDEQDADDVKGGVVKRCSLVESGCVAT